MQLKRRKHFNSLDNSSKKNRPGFQDGFFINGETSVDIIATFKYQNTIA